MRNFLIQLLLFNAIAYFLTLHIVLAAIAQFLNTAIIIQRYCQFLNKTIIKKMAISDFLIQLSLFTGNCQLSIHSNYSNDNRRFLNTFIIFNYDGDFFNTFWLFDQRLLIYLYSRVFLIYSFPGFWTFLMISLRIIWLKTQSHFLNHTLFNNDSELFSYSILSIT